MRFVAVDVETANADMASICSIGAATFEDGRLVDEAYWLVDPEDHFDPVHMSIHGITPRDVMGLPNFERLISELRPRLGGSIIVTHTHFDRVALHRAFQKAQVEMFACTWMDTARVARRTWEECAERGYGLAAVCARIGYAFRHHHALEDAKASTAILLAALAETGLDLAGMEARCTRPVRTGADEPIRRDGDEGGLLHGEVVVFTGALSLTRNQAADLAAAMGCRVASGVTKETTVLVVGDTDIRHLAGHQKSAKHRKAEELMQRGQPIRILGERDFRRLLKIR